jgi:hypothetical protein
MLKYAEKRTSSPQKRSAFTVTYNGTPPSWNPPFAIDIPLDFKIPDITSEFERLLSDDDGDQTKWKSCQHYSAWLAYPRGTYSVPFSWSILSGTAIGSYSTRDDSGAHPLLGVDSSILSNAFGPFGEHSKGLPLMHQDQPDGSFILPPPGVDALVVKSLRTMMPGIKSELSLINSLIELKDFRSLPRLITGGGGLFSLFKPGSKPLAEPRKGKRLSDFQRSVRRTFGGSDLTLREGLQLAADSYLQIGFNILPLLSDITSIFRVISRTIGRINDLVDRQGKRQVRHFTYTWYPMHIAGTNLTITYALNEGQFSQYVPTTGETGGYAGHMLGMEFTRDVLVERPAVFHAELEYSYHLTRFQNEHARLLGFLDALGVSLDPAIIWNAIPWSFIVDWLISVSKWLGDRKVLNLGPVINMSQYLWSWKMQRTIRSSFRSYQVGNCPSVQRTYLPDLNEVAYRRQVGLPGRSSFETSGLNSNEFSLGVALAITRRKRPTLNRGR